MIYDSPFTIYDSQLVERAGHGEEIVIAKAGKPIAKLVPLEECGNASSQPRLPGEAAFR
ncbi:MAG: type II toxin-antitoxin system prevent-host-death family antitoxin [Betaproteobacteria bacterium]|nr:type II toxin-antitoxin system prevent-host-death family antitoxin [Betaproteobacteria bacterium]